MEYPHPYTRCLGGRGQIYLSDCLKPLAHHFGNAEFSFCDMEGVISGGCLTARKMFSQMKEAGFIVKLAAGDSKSGRYALHPDVFKIVNSRGEHPTVGNLKPVSVVEDTFYEENYYLISEEREGLC